MPTSMLALHVSAVSGREVARSFESLLSDGLAESSVRRFRASLSSFFAWCVREKIVLANPVIGVTVPKQSGEVEEMDPFTEEVLEEVHAAWATASPHLADLLSRTSWTSRLPVCSSDARSPRAKP